MCGLLKELSDALNCLLLIPKALIRLKFSLASALGVGVVSMAEFVEIELAEPMEVHEAVQKMTAALPRGIQIMAADVTANNAPALMASAGGADYLVVLPYYGEYVEAVAAFNCGRKCRLC